MKGIKISALIFSPNPILNPADNPDVIDVSLLPHVFHVWLQYDLYEYKVVKKNQFQASPCHQNNNGTAILPMLWLCNKVRNNRFVV